MFIEFDQDPPVERLHPIDYSLAAGTLPEKWERTWNYLLDQREEREVILIFVTDPRGQRQIGLVGAVDVCDQVPPLTLEHLRLGNGDQA